MRASESQASFEDFVRARSSSLLRTAFLLTGQNWAEAEDLLQLALERAYRHWPRVCQSGEPERYIRGILVNASVDRWRLLARRPEVSLQSAADRGVADQAAEVADRDYLMRALACLPPRQRAVVVLRYFDGLQETEIAAALGCSAGSVKTHAARALARLRELSESATTPAAARGKDAGDE
jgi:RNA polymerase sigma-70 factor (sigma-E family)